MGKSFQSDSTKGKFAEFALILNDFRVEVKIISIQIYTVRLCRMNLLYPMEIWLLKLTMKNGQTYFENFKQFTLQDF